MFLTSYASVFILKDSEWVTIQDDLSWAYIRLRTVTASNSNKADAPSTNSTLVLSISSNRGFTPDQVSQSDNVGADDDEMIMMMNHAMKSSHLISSL